MTIPNSNLPQSVDEAVEILHANMSLNEECMLVSMDEVDLIDLHLSLGHDIREDFGLWAGNEALLESCRITAGKQDLHVDDASMVIIKALWERVKKSNIMNSED